MVALSQSIKLKEAEALKARHGTPVFDWFLNVELDIDTKSA